eukprot:CAMPEP_0171187236 /NCGR_PEP_ID=MMETSP0790-20130122/17217_1 /TAXON_ID=2925 /ORGANISM="Alexandrium catenella, Strain OF101" /LENGTH=59 /DNA_ID=CAMNT_0011652291 /DNA_START=226 /DNA_END=401 /DNA_ORIENTATION=+
MLRLMDTRDFLPALPPAGMELSGTGSLAFGAAAAGAVRLEPENTGGLALPDREEAEASG